MLYKVIHWVEMFTSTAVSSSILFAIKMQPDAGKLAILYFSLEEQFLRN